MKLKNSPDLGSAIRTRRKELGYTQQYLSETTGLSTSFLSNLENGKETAEVGKVLLVISLLGLDINIAARGE